MCIVIRQSYEILFYEFSVISVHESLRLPGYMGNIFCQIVKKLDLKEKGATKGLHKIKAQFMHSQFNQTNYLPHQCFVRLFRNVIELQLNTDSFTLFNLPFSQDKSNTVTHDENSK